MPTNTAVATSTPFPTPEPCDGSTFARSDPAEGGSPDFRSLTARVLQESLRIEVDYHAGESARQGTFVRLEGDEEQVLTFGTDSYQLRRDADGDSVFETVVYEAELVTVSDSILSIDLPNEETGVSFRSLFIVTTRSNDRVPDIGSMALTCPTPRPPTRTPTNTATPVPVEEWRAAFEVNRAKWLAQGIESYRYRYELSCYCSIPKDVEITVYRGEIAQVREFITGELVDHSFGYPPAQYLTIDGMFGLIEQAVRRPADFLRVNYHQELGYPVELYIDSDRRLADEEVGIDATFLAQVAPPTLTATPVRSDTPTPSRTPTVTSTPTEPPFVDNGDGTITDTRTGRMFEKKVGLDGVPDPTNLHDADNRYPFVGRCPDFGVCQPFDTGVSNCSAPPLCRSCPEGPTACSPQLTAHSWVEELNASEFAGYSDWRLAAAPDLHALFDLGRFGAVPIGDPPRVYPELHGANCSGDCLDLTDPDCSCTSTKRYWTPSLIGLSFEQAWTVHFGEGAGSGAARLAQHLHVRAVRR